MTADPDTCPACGSTNSRILAVHHEFLRHMDYAPMANQPRNLTKCGECQMVFVADAAALAEARALYEGTEYAEKKSSPYVVFGNGDADGTTYHALADLMLGRLALDGKRVLDFGCFTGGLLEAFDKGATSLECHGYDIAPSIAPHFPRKENFNFWSGDAASIPGEFDLITVVNVLMYVDDVRRTLGNLDSRLNEEGAIFVVVPDCARNPHALLYGDQRTFYTPVILHNIAVLHGFDVEVMESAAFPRSIIALFSRGRGERSRVMSVDEAPERSLAYLDAAKAKLASNIAELRAQNPTGKISVLGVSPNAAWAGQQLNGGIDLYVDENPNRLGTEFRGRPVEHPSVLRPDDVILLPYGETGGAIAEKFEAKYAAKLIVI